MLTAAAVGAAGAVLALALWLPHALDVFEARTWDMRARLLARPGKETSQVVTILLDQKSLDWANTVNQLGWPWPRSLYGMIADFCRLGGARALVLDVLYTEETNEDPGQDQELARGIAENGHVVAAVNLSRAKGQGGAEKWPADFSDRQCTSAASMRGSRAAFVPLRAASHPRRHPRRAVARQHESPPGPGGRRVSSRAAFQHVRWPGDAVGGPCRVARGQSRRRGRSPWRRAC